MSAPDHADTRARILQSAADVLAERGVQGFTHRAVASAAAVPLGLTSYHFRNREQLLSEAMNAARERSQASDEAMLQSCIARSGLARGLAEAVEEWTTRQRDALVMNYRVYLAALYEPSLQTAVAPWHPETALRQYTDQATAALLGHHIEGLLIHAVVNDRSFPADEVVAGFDRLASTAHSSTTEGAP